tara:strand:- start:4789 stop:5169 length:381 start_codon:yes stop_codon:yes gene_type:complete
MSYTRIGNFVIMAFVGGLGLFNSSMLEMRQVTNSNAELIFQNGQIISSAIIFICFSGIIAECLAMKNCKGKKSRPNSLITSDDNLSATEFYDKYGEGRRNRSKKETPKKTFGGVATSHKKRKKSED